MESAQATENQSVPRRKRQRQQKPTPPVHNAYTRDMIQKLNGIKERAWGYTWLHQENSQYLRDWYDRVSYLNFILILLSATSIFATANFCDNTFYIRIITGIITVIAGFISEFLKHKKYEEDIIQHKFASSSFSQIYDNIDRQLSTPIEAQEQAHHFHRWISKEFDMILKTAPNIDRKVIKDYVRKFGNNRPIHPIEAAEYENHREARLEESSTTTSTTEESSNNTSEIVAENDQKTESPPVVANATATAETELKNYLASIRSHSADNPFSSGLLDYQASRMGLNTGKCYMDPLKLNP